MQPRRDIDDYCYKGNRKLKEAVLPPGCKLLKTITNVEFPRVMSYEFC